MKKNNGISPVATIVIMVAIVGGVGYFLFKTSPQSVSTVSSAGAASVGSMHGDTTQLDSLIGKPLPEMHLVDKDGNVYTAESFKGKTNVLFFNEGLMCYPACWNQIASFGSDARFNNDQVQAFSVLVDPSKDWQTAVTQMPELAKSKTLFDVGAAVSGNLGLLTLPSSMHRGSLPGHTYIVVDKEGIVRYVFDDPTMGIANDMLAAKIAQLK